jgi:hypothetical protein
MRVSELEILPIEAKNFVATRGSVIAASDVNENSTWANKIYSREIIHLLHHLPCRIIKNRLFFQELFLLSSQVY